MQCDCKKEMDEYWTQSLEPIHHAQQVSVGTPITQRKNLNLVDDFSGGDLEEASRNSRTLPSRETKMSTYSVSSAGYSLKRKKTPMPECSSCGDYVQIKSHYFRCPTFLTSGSINDVVATEKITKHGRYLCIECGYARMTYLPFLFVFSRNIFTWIYLALLTIFATLLDIDCNILCIDDGTLNNKFHEKAYKELIFFVAIGCHFFSPIFFLLILTTKQIRVREIKAKSFDGKVIKYAQKLIWDKVYELIRHEECDVNEVDRSGRSALIYAAISHNFQVIRDLQQFGADMDHVDINSCGIKHYLDAYHDGNYDDDDDEDNNGSDRLTGPTRAAVNGQTEDLHLCIELGCDLNKVDGNGHTPLIIACKEREIGIIEVLINQANKYGKSKLDINKTDKLGRTAVIIVTQYGYDNVLETLLNEAQDVDVVHRDKEGMSAFEHAISCNQKKCAKIIHQYKKKHNIQETEPPQNDQNEDEQDKEQEDIEIAQNGQDHDIKEMDEENNDNQQKDEEPEFVIIEKDDDDEEDDQEMVIDTNEETENKSEIDRKQSLKIRLSRNDSQLVPDVSASDTEDTDYEVKGDKKKHPIMDSTANSNASLGSDIEQGGTPSQVVLHESDSIDRRIYRALTIEKMKQEEEEKLRQKMKEENNEDLYDDDNGMVKKKQTMSIVVTDFDATSPQTPNDIVSNAVSVTDEQMD